MFREFLKEAVIPAAQKRHKLEAELRESLRTATAKGSAASAPAAAPAPEPSFMICIDGERNGLQSATEVMADLYADLTPAQRAFNLLKWSAACSKTQQP